MKKQRHAKEMFGILMQGTSKMNWVGKQERIEDLKELRGMLSSLIRKLISRHKRILKSKQKKVMVKCDGNLGRHKCEERKCRHRKPHIMRGRCGKKLHNGCDRWCIEPGTTSYQHVGEDGDLVTCVLVQ